MDPFSYYQAAKRAQFRSLPGDGPLAAVAAFADGADLPAANTFGHIVSFLNGGDPPRLLVAAADYGVTEEELRDWRDAKLSPRTAALMVADRIARKKEAARNRAAAQ
jgi:hypothetical protein